MFAYQFTPWQWAEAGLAAVCIGLSMTGFGGVNLLSIVLMADLLPARQSTGAILPMLLFADCFAVRTFRQHALWREIRRLLLAALTGVVAGALIMEIFSGPSRFSDTWFKRIIGGIVLALTLLQYGRQQRPEWFEGLPAGSSGFVWLMGVLAGATTMLANAAGPVVSLLFVGDGVAEDRVRGDERVDFPDSQPVQSAVELSSWPVRGGVAEAEPVPPAGSGGRGIHRTTVAEGGVARVIRTTVAVLCVGRLAPVGSELKSPQNVLARTADHMHLLRIQTAGWSSLVARQAHNLKVVGSNPTPATTSF